MFFCTPGAQIANVKLLKNQSLDKIKQQLESIRMDFPGKAQCETNKANSKKQNKTKQTLA